MNSYLTWLDWYASGAAKKIAAGGFQGTSEQSDAEALWLISVARVASMDISRQRNLPPAEMAEFSFFAAIAAFVAPSRLKDHPDFQSIDSTTRRAMFFGGRGVKMSKGLVKALAYAKAPKSDDWVMLLRAQCWYIDLPHNALMLGSRQIRAILTQPDELGGVCAIAILTEPGSDEIAGRYAWMIVGETAHPQGLADIEIDPAELQSRASDFVALTLLYFSSLEKIEELPRQNSPRLSKIQRKLERKTKSLFTVYVLPEPVNNLNRPDNVSENAGWRLDHRVTVRGHFRWQPVGEGRASRELRWIDEHVRGADLPEKPRLTPLRKKRYPSCKG